MIKLGFLTACLPRTSLEEKAEWAGRNGFDALEVACWPRLNERDYSSSDIDVVGLDQAGAARIKDLMARNGLTISSLAYYDNNIDADPAKRARVNAHLRACIRAAELLGVPAVGTFVGRNIEKSLEQSFEDFSEVFTPIVRQAGDSGVQIIIENCPMIGWQKPQTPGTISFSPELWQEMFKRIPAPNFGLNFDPSHLMALRIDYLPLIREFADRILHVHAKDAEIFPDLWRRYGTFDRILSSTSAGKYWRYRMPGLGQIDFAGIIRELRAIGYNGVMSIEHEDPLYEGSEAKIYEGLDIGRRFLDGLLSKKADK